MTTESRFNKPEYPDKPHSLKLVTAQDLTYLQKRAGYLFSRSRRADRVDGQ
jgi:hypothetical protein